MADNRRSFLNWIWPPPPIARRLWLVLAVASVYTAIVDVLRVAYVPNAPSWANEFAAINAIVIGVLVGFRTKAAYDRWWEGRNLWGALTNTSRNLCLKAVALADPPANDRRELLHLVAGFPFALMRHLRGSVALQDVPSFEKDPKLVAHVPAELAGRLFALIASWRRDGRIDGHSHQLLDPHAAALMDICGACEKIRNTPLPGSYLSLLRHGLILGLILIPWHLTYSFGLWAVLVQGVIVYFLVGIELIAEEVEQPFGFDGDDLPLERYCDTIRANAAEILQVTESIS
jgi:putative membrane protein